MSWQISSPDLDYLRSCVASSARTSKYLSLSAPQNAQQSSFRLEGPGETCPECTSIMVKTRRTSEGNKSQKVPHSAKTRKIMDILHKVQDDSDGTEKTIIFSQFTSMLDVIENFLRDEGIKFVRCE